MFFSNMQLKSNYLQFCIKRNIRNADEQKPISQMSTISLYVYVNHLKLKKVRWYYLKVSYWGKCVLVGLSVTKALNKVIQRCKHATHTAVI